MKKPLLMALEKILIILAILFLGSAFILVLIGTTLEHASKRVENRLIKRELGHG
jgi:preprotein translocase subunit SecG